MALAAGLGEVGGLGRGALGGEEGAASLRLLASFEVGAEICRFCALGATAEAPGWDTSLVWLSRWA